MSSRITDEYQITDHKDIARHIAGYVKTAYCWLCKKSEITPG